MLLKRAGQEILNILNIFVCLTEELIRKKQAGKTEVLHMGKNFYSPIFGCWLQSSQRKYQEREKDVIWQ